MKNETENAMNESGEELDGTYDFNRVDSIARIALYDDLLSAPRVTEVQPGPTDEFIERLSTEVYEQAKNAGGTIPYTVIREVAENFIHARFKEATVSVLDEGNTIRFSDQGPGIAHKEKVQLPGFTSATEPMKRYIRGVGSGLPIVREYLDYTGGTISIEDNLGSGSVVTISSIPSDDEGFAKEKESEFGQPQRIEQPLYGQPIAQAVPQYGTYQAVPSAQNGYMPQQNQGMYENPYMTGLQQQGIPSMQPMPMQPQYPLGAPQPYGQQQIPPQMNQVSKAAQNASVLPLLSTLSDKERQTFSAFRYSNELGVTEISKHSGVAQSTVHVSLSRLEQAGLITKLPNKKRKLTDIGIQLINQI
jgi:DNA-binding transcriptional ArsR family regulator